MTAIDDDIDFLGYELAKLTAAQLICPDLRKQNPTNGYFSHYTLRSDLVKKNFNYLTCHGDGGNYAIKFTFVHGNKTHESFILGPAFKIVSINWQERTIKFSDFLRLAKKRNMPDELVAECIAPAIKTVQGYLKSGFKIVEDKNSKNKIVKLLAFS